jgi:hypothetical protein
VDEGRRRRGPGCCGIIVLVLVIGIGWVAAIRLGVPEKLGLRKPIAEQVFAGPPDREAAQAIREALIASGLRTRGIEVAILPMAGGGGSAAIFTLDASQGFDLERIGQGQVDWRAVDQLLNGTTLADLNVARVAIDYRNASGNSVLLLTARTDDLRRYARGELTEKEFVRSIMGRVDLQALPGEALP